MSFDEEYLSPHGECRHEIHRLEEKLKDQDAYIERLQDQFGAAIEALKGVVRVADRKTVEFDAARAALARAEGQG